MFRSNRNYIFFFKLSKLCCSSVWCFSKGILSSSLLDISTFYVDLFSKTLKFSAHFVSSVSEFSINCWLIIEIALPSAVLEFLNNFYSIFRNLLWYRKIRDYLIFHCSIDFKNNFSFIVFNVAEKLVGILEIIAFGSSPFWINADLNWFPIHFSLILSLSLLL